MSMQKDPSQVTRKYWYKNQWFSISLSHLQGCNCNYKILLWPTKQNPSCMHSFPHASCDPHTCMTRVLSYIMIFSFLKRIIWGKKILSLPLKFIFFQTHMTKSRRIKEKLIFIFFSYTLSHEPNSLASEHFSSS